MGEPASSSTVPMWRARRHRVVGRLDAPREVEAAAGTIPRFGCGRQSNGLCGDLMVPWARIVSAKRGLSVASGVAQRGRCKEPVVIGDGLHRYSAEDPAEVCRFA